MRRMSQREDLRLVLPNGLVRRAYYTNIDRTHARSEYRASGKRFYVYGRIVGDRLVPECPCS